MNIGQNILGSYDTNMQNRNIHSEHVKGNEQVSVPNSNADISSLKEGAVFKGEILDIEGDKVTIALENRAQLQARLQADVELGIGDLLLFTVKENTASQIMIKPMFDSLYSAQTKVLEKALDAAGLSPTEKNFSAVKELMEAGMPVDKGSIVKLLSQSMKFEGTSMQTLVSLNKMNIPVTEANIAQYERYQNYSHQLLGDMEHTADDMASFVKAFPEGTSGTTLLSVAEQVIDIFSESPEKQAAIQSDTSSAEYAGRNENMEIIKDSLNADTHESVESMKVSLDAKTHENAEVMKASLNMQDSDIGKEIKTDVNAPVETNGQSAVSEGSEPLSYQQISDKTGLTKGDMIHLENMLQKAGMSGEQMKEILQGAGSSEELLKNLTNNLSRMNGMDAAIRNILDSVEYKKLFSNMIKEHWSMDPKTMKDSKEIEELYNKILKQGKAFEEAIASKGGEPKEFQQSSQNMRQNMQFMEQLNNQMIYAQMPLKFSGQNVNSELYVYADKRKLMEKKDGISVMLHLDMEHLGMTDIKVTLTGTNVNARFYLNDQKSVDIIADNMEQLEKELIKRGFTLTNEVVKRTPQESVNMVVDEIIDENAERSIKRYTFDMRT